MRELFTHILRNELYAWLDLMIQTQYLHFFLSLYPSIPFFSYWLYSYISFSSDDGTKTVVALVHFDFILTMSQNSVSSTHLVGCLGKSLIVIVSIPALEYMEESVGLDPVPKFRKESRLLWNEQRFPKQRAMKHTKIITKVTDTQDTYCKGSEQSNCLNITF